MRNIIQVIKSWAIILIIWQFLFVCIRVTISWKLICEFMHRSSLIRRRFYWLVFFFWRRINCVKRTYITLLWNWNALLLINKFTKIFAMFFFILIKTRSWIYFSTHSSEITWCSKICCFLWKKIIFFVCGFLFSCSEILFC